MASASMSIGTWKTAASWFYHPFRADRRIRTASRWGISSSESTASRWTRAERRKKISTKAIDEIKGPGEFRSPSHDLPRGHPGAIGENPQARAG